MTWVHVDTRYGRKYSCELHITAEQLVYNHRSYPTVDVEYIQLDPEDETRLNVKFVNRPRPKAFFFISSDACEEAAASIVKVCEAAHKKTKEQQVDAPVTFRVQHTSLPEAMTGVPKPLDMDSSNAGPPASAASQHALAGSHADTLSHPDLDAVSHGEDDELALPPSPDVGGEVPADAVALQIAPSPDVIARPLREALLKEVPQGQIPGSIPAKNFDGASSRAASRAPSVAPPSVAQSSVSLSRNTSFQVGPSPIKTMLKNKTHTFHFWPRNKNSGSTRPSSRPTSPGGGRRVSKLSARASAGREIHINRRSDEDAAGVSSRALKESPVPLSRELSDESDAPGGHGVMGHCLREHPLEVFMFFTLMPLVFAGFWLSDAGRDILDRFGSWIHATCTVHQPISLVAEAFHHGHHSPLEEEEPGGMVLVLERGWNVTVVAPPAPHARTASSRAGTPLGSLTGTDANELQHAAVAAAAVRSGVYADTWMATAVASVEPDERYECHGHIGESLAELRERCTEDGPWAPQIPVGTVRPCYVHRVGDHAVFLDVAEPVSFYADIGVSALCLIVSITSLLSVMRVQRRLHQTAWGKGRESVMGGQVML